MNMGRILPLGAALLSAASMQAQVAFQGSYVQDFDGLGPSGTTLPEGWSAVRHAGSGTLAAPLMPAVTTGTATGGGLYNVGSQGNPDRALGSLASSSTVPQFGVQLQNLAGITYDTLAFQAVMEQWRSGASSSANESLSCEYSLNATGINDPAAQWLPLPGLSLPEKLTLTTSSTAVDGNDPAQQWTLSGNLSGLQWSPGGTLTFRWTDADDAGSDGLYALDNLSIAGGVTPVPEPASVATFLLGAGALAVVTRRRQRLRVA